MSSGDQPSSASEVNDATMSGVGEAKVTSTPDEDAHAVLSSALINSAVELNTWSSIKSLRGLSVSTPPESPVTAALAFSETYWKKNMLTYGDKVPDGFVDVWGAAEQFPLSSSIILDNFPATVEAVLVDRKSDAELILLERKAILVDSPANPSGACTTAKLGWRGIAVRLAELVANRMGGTADSDQSLQSDWRSVYWKIKSAFRSHYISLGLITSGLIRHRVLLFKVLADRVGVPCCIVRGRFYTGTKDDARAKVRDENGSEYVVDLMKAPGLLVPVTNLETPTISPIASPVGEYCDVGTALFPALVASMAKLQGKDGPEPDSRKTRFGQTPLSHQSGDGSGSDVGSSSPMFRPEDRKNRRRSPSWTDGWGSPQVPMLVADVAKENPRFAQRLKAVLQSPDKEKRQLFSDNQAVETEEARLDADKTDNHGENASQSVCEDPNDFSFSKEIKIYTMDGYLIPRGAVSLGERVGLGSFGEVFKGEWNGFEVAVKKLIDQEIPADAVEDFKSEVAMMHRLRHPNILLFMGAIIDPPHLSIVTEFLPRGSIFRLLTRPNASSSMDERRRLKMALDVAKGMNYLHCCNPLIVHRDLKSQNLLVDKNWVVKVCDFGLSKIKHQTYLSSRTAAGTPEWMAPEVLRNEPTNEKSDVYSFGVVLWELSTMQRPWRGLNAMQVVGAVGFQQRRLDIPASVDPAVSEIIRACWAEKPSERPSFSMIVHELKALHKKWTSPVSPRSPS